MQAAPLGRGPMAMCMAAVKMRSRAGDLCLADG